MGQLGDLSPQASIAVSIIVGENKGAFQALSYSSTGGNTRWIALDFNSEPGLDTAEEVASA